MSGRIVSRAQTPGDDVQIGSEVGCAVCNRTDKLLRCSRCKTVFYCTKEHQKRDWKRHKEFCTTHPVQSAAPGTISSDNQNSLLKSAKNTSVRNCQISTVPVVSNLSERSVLERKSESNDTPQVQNNVKHLGGT